MALAASRRVLRPQMALRVCNLAQLTSKVTASSWNSQISLNCTSRFSSLSQSCLPGAASAAWARAAARPIGGAAQRQPLIRLFSAGPSGRKKTTVSQEKFEALVADTLDKLVHSVAEMPEVTVVRPEDPIAAAGSLELAIEGSGSYMFQTEANTKRLVMFSPISGVRKYYWDSDQGWWADSDDHHIMLELWVREMLRLCQGVPNL